MVAVLCINTDIILIIYYMNNILKKMSLKLSLIVAINNADRGIGIGGKLPWRISKG